MPISYDDALKQTDPSAPEEQRDQSAKNIMAGVAASDAYWNSRPDIERLQAQAVGHGQVYRNTDDETKEPAVDSTAVDEASTSGALTPASPTPSTPAPGSITGPAPSPANDTEAIAKLRAQLQSAGINPEA